MSPAPRLVSPCHRCDAMSITTAGGPGERLVAPNEEDVADNEEVMIEEGLDVEVEPLKVAPDPGRPTARQVEEHRRTGHIPYRSWCRWCWLGRGRGTQHRHSIGSTVPIVGFDYFFLTKGGVKKKEELELTEDALREARSKGDIVKCLLARCLASKAVFAHVIPCKGADEDGIVAELAVRDLEWLGHTRVILKADNEPALQALVHRALTQAKVECKDLAQLSKEDPAAYDSQANGGVEVGVQLVRGMMRTHKLCLEARIIRYIPVDHPVVAWMLEHVTLLLNTLVRGTDGITAWMRIRGRPFGQQLVGFGESLLFRYPPKARGTLLTATLELLAKMASSSATTAPRTRLRSKLPQGSSTRGPSPEDRNRSDGVPKA